MSNPKLVVKTSKGAQNGISTCGYSASQNTPISNIPLFLKTNATEHVQQLRDLRKGSYKFYITCIDIAGNIATANTKFDVITETNQPIITQVYKSIKDNVLVVLTTEESSC